MIELLEHLINTHHRLAALAKELALLRGTQTELVHSLICDLDLPEHSVFRYEGRTYHLLADIEEGDRIGITEVVDLNHLKEPPF